MLFFFHWVYFTQLGFTGLNLASFTQDMGSLSRQNLLGQQRSLLTTWNSFVMCVNQLRLLYLIFLYF